MAEQDIRATVRATQNTASRVIKGIAFDVQGELTRTTPVDVGWAWNNWLVSIGRPVTSPAGSRDNVAAATAARTAGEARLLVYNVDQGDVYLQNNVPYIQKLDEGHSKQAPAGFVAAAIRSGITKAIGRFRG